MKERKRKRKSRKKQKLLSLLFLSKIRKQKVKFFQMFIFCYFAKSPFTSSFSLSPVSLSLALSYDQKHLVEEKDDDKINKKEE